jgi:hypothetical protein
MKKTFTFVLLVLLSASSYAQKWENGSTRLNIGLGSIFGLGVVGSIDKGIADNISIGVGASASRYGYLGYNATYFSVGGRGSYHLGEILEGAGIKMDKLDAYLGVNAGYFFGSGNSLWGTYGGIGGISFGGHGGLRYKFSDKLNLMAESGYPYSSLGLSFKFGK